MLPLPRVGDALLAHCLNCIRPPSRLSISFRAIHSAPRNFVVEPRARFREVMGNSGQMVRDPAAIPRARLHDHFHAQLTSPTATPDDLLRAAFLRMICWRVVASQLEPERHEQFLRGSSLTIGIISCSARAKSLRLRG
jgi:hypothetical protein